MKWDTQLSHHKPDLYASLAIAINVELELCTYNDDDDDDKIQTSIAKYLPDYQAEKGITAKCILALAEQMNEWMNRNELGRGIQRDWTIYIDHD